MPDDRDEQPTEQAPEEQTQATPENPPKEFGGVRGPEPTRYGDWENNGRCTDF